MNDNPLLRQLKQVSLFADLDDSILQQLASHGRRRKFGLNETLFHEGDPGHTLYLILSGRVHIQKLTGSGDTLHVASRGPGEHIGELALLDGSPRMADAITAEPTELLILDRTDFIRCIETSPRLALEIMSSLASRLRQAAEHLESHQELDVLGRVSQILLEQMGLHGSADPGGGTRLDVRLTHQDLANQIGATRESVSRSISNLREVGAIRTDGRILVIINARKLRQYCTR